MSAGPPIPDELWKQIPPAAQAAILALIQRYERRLADLEARLKQNSTNSSKPPSSDPPSLKRSPPKPPSRNKAGGQRGHAKVQRALVDHPDAIHDCKPAACRHCQQPLHGDDPQPLRHQVWDVPPVRPIVTEYHRHQHFLANIGRRNTKRIFIGPRFLAFRLPPSIRRVIELSKQQEACQAGANARGRRTFFV
jgi:transposase